MMSNDDPSKKNELDALYHIVKGMSDVELRMVRNYALNVMKDEMLALQHLVPPTAVLVSGPASLQ